MNAESIFQWPMLPPLPPAKRPVLIRVLTSSLRSVARQELRAVLHQVLTAWNGFGQLPLRETACGPEWQGLLDGESLDISLSYCDGEAWVGLIRGSAIGIDAMMIRPMAEAEAVARHFLGDAAAEAIRRSREPAKAFALAWTGLEARLKCLKRGLTEGSAGRNDFEKLAGQDVLFDDRIAVTVATAA